MRRRFETISKVGMGRTRSFLFAHPSSSAGSSMPWRRVRHLIAESGSSNSANPNPCGLFAGVMSRLNDLTGPHAWRFNSNHNSEQLSIARREQCCTHSQHLVKKVIRDPARYRAHEQSCLFLRGHKRLMHHLLLLCESRY